MTNPWEWEEADLLKLIEDQVQESLTLDYKQSNSIDRADRKRLDISKDVASFANSDGGTIVYGIKEKNNNLPDSLDEGINPIRYSKEWMDNIITSNIHPRVEGVHIKEVALSGDRAGKVAYVVHIPKSITAHMSADNRYYRRFNFKAQPMEDYEVRDVMNRSSSPNLEAQLVLKDIAFDNLSPVPVNLGSGANFTTPISFACVIRNTSPAVAVHAIIRFFFDKRIEVNWYESNTRDWTIDKESIRTLTNGIQLTEVAYRHNGNSALPFWQGVDWALKPNMNISFPKMESVGGMHYIGYELMSPGMPLKRVIFTIFNDNTKIALIHRDEYRIDSLS